MKPAPDAAGNRIRRRLDLEFYPQRCRRRHVWVVKDPLSLNYFQFCEEEYRILGWLDGQADLESIQQRFNQRFAPKRLTRSRLVAFIAQLHAAGLLLADGSGQGARLLARSQRRGRRSWRQVWGNPLAIRLPGINPQRFLDWATPKLRWLWSGPTLLAATALVIGVALWALVHLDVFWRALPQLDRMLSPGHLFLFAVVIGGVKVVHELAHALTCRHFGAQCRELGLMLLVFSPCLYCDVSDAWKLPERRQRLAITAAGMAAELVLAALATLVWWVTHSGPLHTLCFHVMLVCSIGTVLINGNPLLRYDGYFLLSDLVQVPNLWQRAEARLRAFASHWLLGWPSQRPARDEAAPRWLVVYALASLAYRVLVITSILYLVYRVLAPRGLQLVALLLVLVVAVRVTLPLAASLSRIVSDPTVRRRLRPRRAVGTLAVSLGLLVVVLWVPLPRRVSAPVLIEPSDARRVYVPTRGIVMEAVRPGRSVRAGESLGHLQNLSLRRQLERTRGELVRQQRRVRSLESLRNERREFSEQLPAAREILRDLQQRVTQLQEELDSLILKAPVAGVVIAPAPRPPAPQSDRTLPTWMGTPLDPDNVGATLERQTLFCLVGQPDTFEAVAYLHQEDAPAVRSGQQVELLLDAQGLRRVGGTVRDVAHTKVSEVPPSLAFAQQIPNETGPEGSHRPRATWYRARIELADHEVPLVSGVRGRARIAVRRQPLAARLWRVLSTTFKPVY